MQSKLSLTGSGLVVLIISMILDKFGLELDEGTIAGGVQNLMELVGLVMTLYGQYRRKDVSYGLLRKTP